MYELAAAKPNWGQVGKGFIPRAELVTNQSALFNAIGILGATVMPHNLYLHSSIIQVHFWSRWRTTGRSCTAWLAKCSAALLLSAGLKHVIRGRVLL